MPTTEAPGIYAQIALFESEQTPFVLVVLAETIGSTPQDAGAKMLVTADGLHSGTVGGGKVEAKAIAHAQDLLTTGTATPTLLNWALKGDVGMTCGGSVKLYFEPHHGGSSAGAWPVWIFGAGHVVQALLPVLAPLECQITVCDPRREWLDRLPRSRNVRYLQSEDPPSLVPSIPERAFVLCLTRGHASDLPVLRRVLAERAFPYVGVIGSAAKAAVLRRELLAAGIDEARINCFHCPIGLAFGSNRPHEIALSIAAQLLTERDRLNPVP